MIQLQRASAGSGKTYTLTGKFIRLYLTVDDHESPRRLRAPEELRECVGRILAITFTNKATNEMKARIVSKLAAMAFHKPGDKTDYIADIARETGSTEQEVATLARRGLAELLHGYSDFRVSTIDSFFQSILRTFAYEAELNDTYEVEIDSDIVRKAGIDATLADVNSDEKGGDTARWIRSIMSDMAGSGNSQWNIFQSSMKDDDPTQTAYSGNDDSMYGRLSSAVQRMSTEDYKRIKGEIDAYFEEHPEWETTMEFAREYCMGELMRAFAVMRREGGKCARFVEENMIELPRDTRTKRGKFLLPALRIKEIKDPLEKSRTKLKKIPHISVDEARGDLEKSYKGSAEGIIEAFTPFNRALEAWLRLREDPKVRLWQIYSPHIPFLGLMHAVKRNSAEYLRDNNLVELDETNMLLSRIIGDDDTPFIYERTGVMTDHYLIDEFQDTSAMQWSNLRPLMRESESRGNENLIIGDAKQSIYRFRNADSTLITRVVPGEFPDHEARGTSEADNTNWRSARRIVEFNNATFRLLSRHLADMAMSEEAAAELRDLYGYVVQKPHNTADEGYVRLEYVDDYDTRRENRVIEIIQELLKRGYRQRDIAVLVFKNKTGAAIIRAMTQFNANLPEGGVPIDFVSEESLLIAESKGVKVIVGALATIARGMELNVRSGDEGDRKGVADVHQIESGFSFYAMKNPEMDPSEKVEAYLSDPKAFTWIDEMIADMQSVALPSLVEGIIANLSEDVRRTDAPYLAAFQDLVLEYSEKYPADTASFVNWWNKNKARFSISSPAGVDAVNVMTVHKSKGLEFKCVIIPEAVQDFSESLERNEWRWVRPSPEIAPGMDLPPYLPIETGSNLLGTLHDSVRREFVEAVRKDMLNALYVGFTRAVDELYVLFKGSGKRAPGIDTFGEIMRKLLPAMQEPEGDYLPAPGDVRPGTLVVGTDEDDAEVVHEIWEMGKPGEPKGSDDGQAGDLIESYRVLTGPAILSFKEEKPSRRTYDDDDPDPRSEGNILHDIMSMVHTPGDIERAVRNMRVQGVITRAVERDMTAMLKEAVSNPEVAGWFAEDVVVINERAILGAGTAYRPDRIVVDKEGNATVIDYKFGESRGKDAKYRGQVGNYVKLLRATGRFRSVRGCLWYVKLGLTMGVA